MCPGYQHPHRPNEGPKSPVPAVTTETGARRGGGTLRGAAGRRPAPVFRRARSPRRRLPPFRGCPGNGAFGGGRSAGPAAGWWVRGGGAGVAGLPSDIARGSRGFPHPQNGGSLAEGSPPALTAPALTRPRSALSAQMLSRAKPAVGGTPPPGDRRRKKGKKVPQLEELLALRDFTGAIALLEVTAEAETPARGGHRGPLALPLPWGERYRRCPTAAGGGGSPSPALCPFRLLPHPFAAAFSPHLVERGLACEGCRLLPSEM